MRLAAFTLALVMLAGVGCGPRRDTSGDIHGIPYLYIDVAGKGTIVIELFPADAPKNVRNIVKLVRHRFYDGLTFHRVVTDFIVQGGCPRGDGSGSAGYILGDEIVPTLKHVRGTVALANSGPNTNSCQFYICLKPQPDLDGTYTIIGQVVDGMDVVDRIAVGDVMQKVWIVEKKK